MTVIGLAVIFPVISKLSVASLYFAASFPVSESPVTLTLFADFTSGLLKTADLYASFTSSPLTTPMSL